MTAGDVVATGVCSLEARQGAAFDGTDDYILADAHAVARVAANDTTGTYSAWIYLDYSLSTTTNVILSAGDNDNTDQFMYFMVYGNTLKFLLQEGGATKINVGETTGSIVMKKWTHIALVQNGVQPELYVNGIKRATTNSVSTDLTMWYDELTNVDKFAIGVKESNNTHTGDWPGMISDVKYWNKALTAAEILKDYNGEALADDATYLQLHLLKSGYGATGYGITDQGLGADNGTLTGHAYLTGYGSEWSRQIDIIGAVVADNITSVPVNTGFKIGAASAVVKAA